MTRALVASCILLMFLGCLDGGHEDLGFQREALRPTAPDAGGMFRYDGTEVVESLALDGGAVRVHFSRSGPNAIPDGGEAGVRLAAERYEDLLRTYQAGWGYPRALSDGALADNGGDDRLDVYLLDFGGRSDGAFRVDECLDGGSARCIGYIVQENDYAGYGYPSLDDAVTILASHEYFHAVQAALDNEQTAPISEGSAVWATERYAPLTQDFERFLPAFLAEPSRTLDLAPAGPATASAYGTALFFRFLEERHGPEVIRDAWLHCQDGRGYASEPEDQANPRYLVQLDAALRERDAGFPGTFLEFARWNLLLGPGALPDAGYRDAARYPVQAVEDRSLPVSEAALRLYYASARPLRVPLEGRTRLRVALSGEGRVGPVPAGVGAVLAFRDADGGTLAARVLAPAGEVAEVPPGATQAVVALVNGARGPVGSVIASRPAVCIGSEAEVAACLAPDAGVDGGLPPGPAACGCSGGAGGGGSWPAWLALALAGGLAVRRRAV